MAGLREELDLDVSAALRQVNQVEAALGSAAKSFRVELAQALDVLRRADTSVRITADAKGVTGSIDAAVQDANTHVTVDADSNLGEVADDAQEVTDNLGHADRAAAGFGGTLGSVKGAAVAMVAAFGIRAVVDGIRTAVDAASDLAESTSKVRVVFGQSAGEIERWGDTSATAVGLAKQEALEAAGTFGNLFTALGSTREEATKMAPEVVQLGADLASFNNLGVDETLEKLRSGLVGEVEPLRSLGVSFNAAQVEAKGMELGLADAHGELSEGAKVQARYALILEQTKAAQGDFARTSDGLANQQRILTAEMGNLRAEVGAALLPVVLELVGEFRDAMPAIRDVALSAVPALSAGVRAFIPVGTSMLTLLTSFGPVLELAADLIGALPAPVLQLVTAFGALGSGLGPLPNLFSQFMVGARGSATASGGLMAGFSALNPWVLGASVALVGITSVLGAHQKEQRENEAAIKAATSAFRDQSTAIAEDVAALAKSRVESKNQVDDLKRLGLSFAEFAELVRQGASGYEDFTRKLVKGGELKLRSDMESVTEAIRTYGSVQGAVAAGAITGNTGLLKSYERLGSQVQEAARDQLDYLVVNEEVSRSEVKAATARHKLSDGTVDYVGVLEDVQPAAKDADDATTTLTSSEEDQTKAVDAARKAYDDLISSLDEYLGRQVSGLEANIGYEQSLDDLTASIKENGRTLDLNTEKGRSNQKALLDTRQAIIDVAKQRLNEGGTAKDAADSVALHTLRLAGELRQAKFTEQQIRDYIAALHLTPADVETVIKANVAPATTAVTAMPGVFFRKGEESGTNFGSGVQSGIDKKRAELVGAATRAALAVADTVAHLWDSHSPSRVGISLGGFFVQGLVLGMDEQRENAREAAAAIAGGVAGAVREAAKITQSETLNILQGVKAVRDAEVNLAEVRKNKKSSTLDLRIAELELAEARAEVNRRYADAVDTTDALTDAMARQREEAGRLGRELDAALGALDALGGVRSAQRRLVDAQRELSEAQSRQAQLPGEIAAAEAALARARTQSSQVTAREAQSIVQARQAVKRAEENLAEVTKDADADNLDREAATIAVTVAQEDLAAALAESVAPTADVERAEERLKDLREEQAAVARRVQEATDAVTDAQLALVSATRSLIEAGDDLAGNQSKMEEFFRAIGTAAGLSRQEIEKLIEMMRNAEKVSGQLGGVTSGGKVAVAPGTQIQLPNGQWIDAGLVGGLVNPDTITRGPGQSTGGTRADQLPRYSPISATSPVPQVTPVAPITPSTGGAAAIVSELQRLANQNPDNIIIGADGRRVTPTVNIYPKTAVYDPKQTAATLRTLELLS